MSALPQLHRYHQLYLVLRQRIVDGRYGKSALIPSERDLAAEFRVARITVRSALSALEREGLIRREQGRGTIVDGRHPVSPSEGKAEGFELLFDSILTMGQRTESKVLDIRTMQAPASVALALDLAPASLVCRVVRVRSLEAIPISYSVVWLVSDLAQDLVEDDLEKRPLLSWLAEKGVEIKSSHETITACAADIDVAIALDISVGSPLLNVRRTAFDQEDRAVLFFEGQFHPEHYRYQLELSHVDRATRVTVAIF